MNIKTILVIAAITALSGIAHAKDENKAKPSAATSSSESRAQSSDQKKPAAAPANPDSDKAADGGPRLKKSDKWSR